MAKKDKVASKITTKDVKNNITKEEKVIINSNEVDENDLPLDLGLDKYELIESNVGTFEEEIMKEEVELDVVEEVVVVETPIQEVVELDVVSENIQVEIKNNNPCKFKRMFGYIWNGQVCDE